jgi:site-specific recombinase XerD
MMQPSNMTIHKAIETYLNNRAKRLSANTISAYKGVLGHFSRWLGIDRDLSTITDIEIDDYQIVLQEQVSNNTQLYRADILRTFFKFWAIRNESQVLYDAIEGPRREEFHPNFIRQEQFDLINDYFDEDEYYQLTKKLIFNLLWDTGMRIGELLALNMADLQTTKRSAVISTEKTKRLRMVAWSDYTHSLLLRYLGTRICLNDASALFLTPSRKGHRVCRLTTRSVQRWCSVLGKELGFAINPHAFRHGKMHAVINAGGSRHHVQAIAGHSSIQSSEVYVRLNEQEQMAIQNKYLNRSTSRTQKKHVPFPQPKVAWAIKSRV